MGRPKDIITEKEFNQQVAHRKTLSAPENDSPGDSELDAGEEFEMGVEFTPESAFYEENEDLAAFDQPDHDLIKENRKTEKEIPSSARGISSELPSPWADAEKNSSTN